MSVTVKNNELWLGFRHHGLQIVSLLDGTISSLQFPDKSNLGITKVLHSTNNTSWIGTYHSGLFKLDKGKIRSLYSENPNEGSTIDEQSITALCELKNGKLLIGTEGGIYEFDPQTDIFSPIQLDIQNTEINPVILSIAESNNGAIWVGTKDQGAYLLAGSDESTLDGSRNVGKLVEILVDSTVYAIEFDRSNHAWLSTPRGLVELDEAGVVVNVYTAADGLQGDDFNFGASHKDQNGLLYFGGSNGYSRFDPSKIEIDSIPPPIVLTDLNIAGRKPTLPVALRDLEVIELAHSDYFITILFSALDFVDPSKNQYSYKLVGFDPEWIDNDTRNSATYTNLPAGEYTFRVRGASSTGVWNLEGASIRVRVLPPYWLTWWAFVIYAVVGLTLVYLAKRFYDDRIITRRATARVREMQGVAEMANDELQEQLEIQDELVKSAYRHNIDTLQHIGNFIALQSEFFEDEALLESIAGNQGRVAALGQLESCLYYQGDTLFADLSRYVDLIFATILQSSPIPIERIATTNEIGNRLVPIGLATPLALLSYELLLNCVLHAFDDDAAANFILITLEQTHATDEQESELTLTVRDSGSGIPGNISIANAESTGFAIVSSVARQIGGHVDISTDNGTVIVISIPGAPELLLPFGGQREFHS
jgi:two-component sensor histidine kinase